MAGKLDQTIETLMSSVENHISTKTVMGEPIVSDGITVFPIADVSFGIAAGAFNKEKQEKGAGGVGAKVSPSALLVVQNGTSKIINIKDTDSINKLINMIPDILNKISAIVDRKKETMEMEEEKTEIHY